MPDYASLGTPKETGEVQPKGNRCVEAGAVQCAVFRLEVQQCVAALKIQSYLRMYASIELPKLARFRYAETSNADYNDLYPILDTAYLQHTPKPNMCPSYPSSFPSNPYPFRPKCANATPTPPLFPAAS